MRDAVRSNCQNFRAVFDSCVGPTYGHMTTISGPPDDQFTYGHMQVLSEPPELPTSFNKALKGEPNMEWIKSVFEVFNKNQKVNLFNTLTY